MSLRTWDKRTQPRSEILSRGRQRHRIEGWERFDQTLPKLTAKNRYQSGNSLRYGSTRVEAPSTYTYWSRTCGVIDIRPAESQRIQSARRLNKESGSDTPLKEAQTNREVLNRVPAKELPVAEGCESHLLSEDFETGSEESRFFWDHTAGDTNKLSVRAPPTTIPATSLTESPREGGVMESSDTVGCFDEIDTASDKKPQTEQSFPTRSEFGDVIKKVQLARASWPRGVSEAGGRKASPDNRRTSFELELPSNENVHFPSALGRWLLDQAQETLKQKLAAAAAGGIVELDDSAAPDFSDELEEKGTQEHEFLLDEKPLGRVHREEFGCKDDVLYDTFWGYEQGSDNVDDRAGPLFIPAVPEGELQSGPVSEDILPKRCRKGIDGAMLKGGMFVRSGHRAAESDGGEGEGESAPLLELFTARRTAERRKSSKPKRFFRFSNVLYFVAGVMTSAASLYLRRKDASPGNEDNGEIDDDNDGSRRRLKYSPFDKSALFHCVM